MRIILAILIFACLFGCGSPIGRGVQKTLHYATLGLVNDPNVSDAVKQDVINHQADNAAALAVEEIARAAYKDYHRVALGTYILGLGIIVFSFINVPALSFLTKPCWKVGAGIVAGAGVLSLYATLAAEPETIKYMLYGISAMFLIGCAYLVHKLAVKIKQKKPPTG